MRRMPSTERARGAREPDLAERLSRARRRSGLTMAQVADRLGKRRSAVWEMENRTRRVLAEELGEIASMYNTTEATLLGKTSTRARDMRTDLIAAELAGMNDAELDRLEGAIRLARRVPRSGRRRRR